MAIIGERFPLRSASVCVLLKRIHLIIQQNTTMASVPRSSASLAIRDEFPDRQLLQKEKNKEKSYSEFFVQSTGQKFRK
jgi:hypothetical protein